jgi:hypothetical protein
MRTENICINMGLNSAALRAHLTPVTAQADPRHRPSRHATALAFALTFSLYPSSRVLSSSFRLRSSGRY